MIVMNKKKKHFQQLPAFIFWKKKTLLNLDSLDDNIDP